MTIGYDFSIPSLSTEFTHSLYGIVPSEEYCFVSKGVVRQAGQGRAGQTVVFEPVHDEDDEDVCIQSGKE